MISVFLIFVGQAIMIAASEFTLLHSEITQNTDTLTGWSQGELLKCQYSMHPVLFTNTTTTKVFTFDPSTGVIEFLLFLELYIIRDQEQQNNIIIHINSIPTQYNIISQGPKESNQCIYDEEETLTNIKLPFTSIDNKVNITIESVSRFAFKQFHMYGKLCSLNCKVCKTTELCEECSNGISGINKDCTCSQAVYEGQCVQECPQNYRKSDQGICVETITTKILSYLEQPFPFSNVSIDNIIYAGLYEANDTWSQLLKIGDVKDIVIDFELVLLNVQNNDWISVSLEDAFFMMLGDTNAYYGQSSNDCKELEDCRTISIKSPIIQGVYGDILLSVTANEFKLDKRYVHNSTFLWGIRNIQVHEVNKVSIQCSPYCDRCTQSDRCLKCADDSLAYRNQCLKQCPTHAFVKDSHCIDLQDIMPYSEYVVKALYNGQSDMNIYFLGSFTQGISQQLHHRILNNQLFFGGSWNGGQYSKVLTLNPHYQVQLRMAITFIDMFSDNQLFQVQIDDGNAHYVVPRNKIYLGGSEQYDSVGKIDLTFNHTADNLMVTLGCFDQCYISNYFIIVRQCHPYCVSCTGPLLNDCLRFSSDQNKLNGFQPNTKTCRSGYYQDQQLNCNKCIFRCKYCKHDKQCNECKTNCTLKQLTRSQMQCVCNPN